MTYQIKAANDFDYTYYIDFKNFWTIGIGVSYETDE